jgi:hypothetical protein
MKLRRTIIKRLRDLARDYHAAHSNDQSPHLGDISSEGNEDYFTDPRRKHFKEIVNSLSKEERAELLALIWLGKGDEGVTLEDWDSLLEHAKKEDDEGTADYLIGKSPLADYIDKGLKKMDDDLESKKRFRKVI